MYFALRLYNSYYHAHASGQHMWPSRAPRPHSNFQVLEKSGNRNLHNAKPCKCDIANDKIQERKIIESTAI